MFKENIAQSLLRKKWKWK